MPYVFKEILDEGETECQVVEKELFDTLQEKANSLEAQLEQAVQIAEDAQKQAETYKSKYMTAFLDSASKPKVKEPVPTKKLEPKTVQSFSELF